MKKAANQRLEATPHKLRRVGITPGASSLSPTLELGNNGWTKWIVGTGQADTPKAKVEGRAIGKKGKPGTDGEWGKEMTANLECHANRVEKKPFQPEGAVYVLPGAAKRN